jgi:DHA1 family bicyclomycin/chloramphenicol resistance-like MFS transporter
MNVLLVGLVAMMAISTDLYLPSLPAIARDLDTDVSTAQLTLSGFLVGIALGQILVGPLSDRFGRRPVLLVATGLYVLASVACALAPDIDSLIAARIVQAFGACAGGVVGRAVVRDVHEREAAARVLATIGAAMAIVPAVGPVLGGVIEMAAGWRWNFALLASFGMLLCAGVALGLPETNRHRDRTATDPARLARNFAAILATRSFLAHAAAGACAYAGLFAFISGSSFVFVDGYGISPQVYGFCFALAVVGYLIGTLIAARRVQRIGTAVLLRSAGWVMCAGGIGMAILVASGLAAPGPTGAALVAVAMAVYCVGFGMCSPGAAAGAIAPFPRLAGTAAAALGALQTGSAAIVGFMVGRLHDDTGLPMALTIAGLAIAGVAAFRLLTVPDRLEPGPGA